MKLLQTNKLFTSIFLKKCFTVQNWIFIGILKLMPLSVYKNKACTIFNSKEDLNLIKLKMNLSKASSIN